MTTATRSVAVGLLVCLVVSVSAHAQSRDTFPTGTIAFVNQRTSAATSWEIDAIAADGSDRHVLAANVGRLETALSWSADATVLLATPERSGTGASVALINASGGMHILTHTGWDDCYVALPCGSLSPDGRRVVYTGYPPGASTPQLYLVDASGGNGHFLIYDTASRNVEPAWSPDGTQVAFVRETGRRRTQLRVVRADGSGGRAVASVTHDIHDLQWSPDGKAVMFEANGGTYVATVAQNHVRLLARKGFAATWSADGSRIAFCDDAGSTGLVDVAVMSSAGGTARRLARAASGQGCRPSWSPDGRWIAFIERGPSGSPYADRVSIVRDDGSQRIPLTKFDGYKPSVAWAPA